MKYSQYTEEDFIKDEYFQKWVLNSDQMAVNFWQNWISMHPEQKETIEKAALFIRLMNNDQEELVEEDFDKMWQFIVQERDKPKKKAYSLRSKKSIEIILRVAAILIVFISISFGAYKLGVFDTVENTPAPSEPRITLELHDGTIKYLDEVSSEIITDKKGRKIVSHKENVLMYQHTSNESETLVYNQLSVPYGKKFELLLSDGSRVFLNSGSKLRYPVNFLKDKPRDVFLDGEAYFSVEKDNTRLFTVITDELNTQVYGTEFNVSSYKNENNTSTVLVEGSVGVYRSNNNKGENPIMITPGKRAVYKNGTIQVNKVNVNKYTAWKEGKLLFINDRFDVIIKELERHFDVTINNQFHQLNEKKFTGTFTDERLEGVLRVFKEHSAFNYAINGDTITINKN